MSRNSKPYAWIGGVVIAPVLALFSWMSIWLFVHTYCENRPAMVALAMAGVGTAYLLVRQWPSTLWSKIAASLALLLCLFETAFNVWYFAWATRVCAEQKRLH